MASSSSSSPLSITSTFIENFEAENEHGGRVMCDCPGGFRARLFCTRKLGTNFGRRFYGCSNWDKKQFWKQDKSRPFCNICKWVDAKYPIRTAEVIIELKSQRDGLERERDEFREEGNQLRMKLSCMCGKLGEKSKEVSEMRKKIQMLKSICYMMGTVVVFLVIVVVLVSRA